MMQSRSIFTITRAIACLLAMLVIQASNASSVLPVNLDQLVAGARDIVHVRCIGNQVQSDPLVGVATVTAFEVLDRPKGAPAPTLSIRQAGGELDGLVVDFRVPKFKVGNEYVLFMPAPSAAGLASPVGLAQGVFGVVAGQSGKQVGNGQDLTQVLTGTAAASMPGVGTGSGPAAPPPPQLHMDLGDFMALARARTAQK